MATAAYETTRFHVQWVRAIQAGLWIGGILFLLTRGIPWVGSGAVNPAVMGREIAPGTEAVPTLAFGVLLLHMLVSVIYALIIAPIVNNLRPFVAGAVGGLIGLILYFISYAVTGMLLDTPPSQREWPAFVLHITFGIFTAELYKGLIKRRETAPIL